MRSENMLDIIVSPEYTRLLKDINRLKGQIPFLIGEKDELLYHVGVNLKADYLLKVGELEYELFELQCQTLRTKRKIEFFQACINRQEEIDEDRIEKELELEYHEYIEKLHTMAKDLDYARFLKDCWKLTKEEARELKRLYRMIVKKIHPDVYPHLEEKDKLYWSRAVEAYEKGDLEMLRTLRELIEDREPKEAEKGSALEELADKQEQLLSTVKHLLETIDRIKKAFPFTEEEFLADKEKVAAKRADLKAAIKESREILEDYQFRLTLFTKPESSIIC